MMHYIQDLLSSVIFYVQELIQWKLYKHICLMPKGSCCIVNKIYKHTKLNS